MSAIAVNYLTAYRTEMRQSPVTSAADEKRKPRIWISWILAGLLFVVYPLSIGPINALFRNGHLSHKATTVAMYFYSPVRLVIRNSPQPVVGVFERYLQWWADTIP